MVNLTTGGSGGGKRKAPSEITKAESTERPEHRNTYWSLMRLTTDAGRRGEGWKQQEEESTRHPRPNLYPVLQTLPAKKDETGIRTHTTSRP